MALAPRATASNAQASFASTTLAIPSSGVGGTVVPGDVAYAVVQINSLKTVTAPSLWILVASSSVGFTANLYRKVLTSGDIAHNAVWSWTGSDFCQAAAAIYSGDDSSTGPEDVSAQLVDHTSASTSIGFPALTTVTNGDELIAIGVNGANVGTWTTPAGYAARVTNGRIGIFDQAQVSAGVASAGTITTDASSTSKGVSVAIRPLNTSATTIADGFFQAF